MLLNPNPAVDVTQVKADYPLVTAAVVNDYILASKANKVNVLLHLQQQNQLYKLFHL